MPAGASTQLPERASVRGQGTRMPPRLPVGRPSAALSALEGEGEEAYWHPQHPRPSRPKEILAGREACLESSTWSSYIKWGSRWGEGGRMKMDGKDGEKWKETN